MFKAFSFAGGAAATLGVFASFARREEDWTTWAAPHTDKEEKDCLALRRRLILVEALESLIETDFVRASVPGLIASIRESDPHFIRYPILRTHFDALLAETDITDLKDTKTVFPYLVTWELQGEVTDARARFIKYLLNENKVSYLDSLAVLEARIPDAKRNDIVLRASLLGALAGACVKFPNARFLAFPGIALCLCGGQLYYHTFFTPTPLPGHSPHCHLCGQEGSVRCVF